NCSPTDARCVVPAKVLVVTRFPKSSGAWGLVALAPRRLRASASKIAGKMPALQIQFANWSSRFGSRIERSAAKYRVTANLLSSHCKANLRLLGFLRPVLEDCNLNL